MTNAFKSPYFGQMLAGALDIVAAKGYADILKLLITKGVNLNPPPGKVQSQSS
jgi:hypothetical protein